MTNVSLGLVALALVFAILIALYIFIIVLTPPPIAFTPSENFYISASARDKPLPLPSLDDEATVDLSVVIPAYNEERRLPPALSITLAHLLSIPSRSFEIIYVDDGSSDKTVDAALSTPPPPIPETKKSKQPTPKPDVRVVKLSKNRGKGAAVKHGFLHARGKRILMVDADGASRFEDLELLWKEMDRIETSEGHGVAVGSRAHMVGTDAVVKRSFIRNLLMYGLHFCLRTLGVGHIRDTQCGFKLFTRASARALFPPLHISHWIFDVELLLLARMLSIPVAEVPIAWHEVEGSKINFVSDSAGMLRDLVVLRANYALGRWKVGDGSIRRKRKPERGEEALRPAVWGGAFAALFIAWTLFGYGGYM